VNLIHLFVLQFAERDEKAVGKSIDFEFLWGFCDNFQPLRTRNCNFVVSRRENPSLVLVSATGGGKTTFHSSFRVFFFAFSATLCSKNTAKKSIKPSDNPTFSQVFLFA
jgi:hypothetical protein